eukprot:347046-Rhodomonas_salina.2
MPEDEHEDEHAREQARGWLGDAGCGCGGSGKREAGTACGRLRGWGCEDGTLSASAASRGRSQMRKREIRVCTPANVTRALHAYASEGMQTHGEGRDECVCGGGYSVRSRRKGPTGSPSSGRRWSAPRRRRFRLHVAHFTLHIAHFTFHISHFTFHISHFTLSRGHIFTA